MKRAKTTKRNARGKTRKSETIHQCAGFDIDPTGDSDYAGSDQLGDVHIKAAKQALAKITALSPIHTHPAKPSLSVEEMAAKAAILPVMMNHTSGNFEHEEKVFLRLFARE